MKLKLKVEDEVQVIAGSDKGVKGSVLEVSNNQRKVRVKGVRVQTCFDKEKGIQKKEGFIDRSNVKVINPAPKKEWKKKKKATSKENKKGLFSQ